MGMAEKISLARSNQPPIVALISNLESSPIGYINPTRGEFAPATLKGDIARRKENGATVPLDVEALLGLAAVALEGYNNLLIHL